MRAAFVLAGVTLSVTMSACATGPGPLGKRPHDPSFTPAGNGKDPDIETPFTADRVPLSSDDAIVRVVGPQTVCSGTVIAEDLVLTAHHCIVERTAKGEFTSKSVRGSLVHIEIGHDYLPYSTAGVSSIVAPPCGESGGKGDIAILVLDRKLVGMPTFKARLDGSVQRDETVFSVGFGHCQLSPEGIRLRYREGGRVTETSSGWFKLRTQICPGDSGGPLLAAGSYDVVGVVSMGAIDADEKTQKLSLGARIDTFRSVFSNARLIADGTDASDLPPLSCE